MYSKKNDKSASNTDVDIHPGFESDDKPGAEKSAANATGRKKGSNLSDMPGADETDREDGSKVGGPSGCKSAYNASNDEMMGNEKISEKVTLSTFQIMHP